jgi:hypothetical protein
LDEIPTAAVEATLALLDGLRPVFGDDLVGAWLHGGTTFPDRPEQPGDLDICFVLTDAAPEERDPDRWMSEPESRPRRAHRVQRKVAADHGRDFDITYVLRHEMAEAFAPEAFNKRRRLLSWPVFTAHWLEGQYVQLAGLSPLDLVRAPTSESLALALDREVEHLERHVYEGDARDPYEATYAMWNGCRILYTIETGSPAISKRSAGLWALGHLPSRWHPAILAAGRSYDGRASAEDEQLLAESMAPFVAMVRERVPIVEPRPDGPPRWS